MCGVAAVIATLAPPQHKIFGNRNPFGTAPQAVYAGVLVLQPSKSFADTPQKPDLIRGDKMPASDPQNALITRMLTTSKTIAVVGASANPDRPSHAVMRYMQHAGYRMIPVNPGLAGSIISGETCRAALAEIEVPVDMVDVFRQSAHCPAIADDAVAIGARYLWLQIGVISPEAAAIAAAGGLKVVMDRCPKIEHEARLGT